MDTYAQLSIHIFLPMAIGALAILILALTKGEICPGQRGRLHKQLPILACLFFIGGGAMPAFIVPAGLLVYFSVQTKTGKTRDSGPLFLLLLAGVSATLFWVLSIVNSEPRFVLGSLSIALGEVIFLGAALGHLLMIRAKTRLQAFHTLLPVAGIASAMLLVLSVLVQAHWAWSEQSDVVISVISVAFPLLLTAILVWSWHLFRSSTVNQYQVLVASALGISGSYLLLPLF